MPAGVRSPARPGCWSVCPIFRLDEPEGVGESTNMRATLLLRERRVLGEGRFAEIVLWRVPPLVPGSAHEFKYRLAYVIDGVCVLRFDNETGKGDHQHSGDQERTYTFTSPERLIDDFWNAIENWRPA
jgi:hypothetical protein